MTNGTDSDMKVTAMLFRLAVIVPTTKVEAVADEADEADVNMEDAVIILDMVAIATLEL
jgi:hypothetical protein